MNLNEPLFVSIAPSATGPSDAPCTRVSVADILAKIRDGEWQHRIQQVRTALATEGKDASKAIKLTLPAVLWSGEFATRKNSALIRHSGLVCVDFDHVENPAGLRDQISGGPHCVAVWLSPSGDGVKALLACDATRPHGESWKAVNAYCKQTFGHEIDKACKNVARLCFVSADADAFIASGEVACVPYPPADDVPATASAPGQPNASGLLSPGDDFNIRGDVPALLRKYGWTSADDEEWTRPGKESGVSATLGTLDEHPRALFVFTSSPQAAPFEANGTYQPFAIFALLEHGGDFTAAAAKLRELGFGSVVTIEDATEDIGFFPPDRYFLRRPDGRGWEERRESSILRLLRGRGLGKKCEGGATVSPVEAALLHIQTNQSVAYAGPQTAFPPGIHQHGNIRFLVTEGIELIEPKQGDPEPFLGVLRGLCGVGVDPLGETQLALVLGWLKHWLHAERNYEQHIPGQTLGFGGGHGVGKNLIGGLFGLLSGGRTYDPHRNFSGADKFNDEMLGSVLALSHDPKFKDEEAARLFWQSHKELVANRSHSIRAMYTGARTMPLAAVRGLVTFNLSPESSRILPPVLLEAGTSDKVILVHAYPPATPFPAQGTPGNESWYKGLEASLPAVAWFLEHEFVLPAHLTDARFGVKEFCHPAVRLIIESNHADCPLGELIDAWFGQAGNASAELSGPATLIYSHMLGFYETTLRTVSRSPVHMGHQLRRLRELDGWRERIHVEDERIPPNNQRRTVWTITAPATAAAA